MARTLIAVLLALSLAPFASASTPVQPRHHQVLELPGVPVSIVPADLDGDGTLDLVFAVAFTEWGSVTEDHLEGAIQALEVVPALFDRRELRAYLRQPDGSYRSAAPPLAIPLSVHALEAGPPGLPLIAVTDEGVSVLRLANGADGPALVLTPLLRSVPAFAGSEVFLPGLNVVQDVDRDGTADLLWPGRHGLEIYRGTAAGLSAAPAFRAPVPGDARVSGIGSSRQYPLPVPMRVDGGTVPDLLFRGREPWVMNGEGGCAFGAATRIELGCLDVGGKRVVKKKKEERTYSRELAYVGDLDGDGRIEAVTSLDLAEGDGLKEAKNPRRLLRVHRLQPDLTFDATPYTELEANGIPFGGGTLEDAFERGGFTDLDGDGRLDYATVTLKFSALQIVRVMATKKMSIGLLFNVWHQEPDGRFREVKDLELEDTLKLDLNDVQLNRLAEFAGDFDGDGRVDFVHLGRGKEITVVRGQPGCRYAKEPDFTIELGEAPQDLGLVKIRDLDGDGKADLALTHVGAAPEKGVSAPVRIELVTSRGAR